MDVCNIDFGQGHFDGVIPTLELKLGDELHVARAAVAEIRIKRIRCTGQREA